MRVRHFYVLNHLTMVMAVCLHTAAFSTLALLLIKDVLALEVCMVSISVCVAGFMVAKVEAVSKRNLQMLELTLMWGAVSNCLIYWMVEPRQISFLLSWAGLLLILANSTKRVWKACNVMVVLFVWIWNWAISVSTLNNPPSYVVFDKAVELMCPVYYFFLAFYCMKTFNGVVEVLFQRSDSVNLMPSVLDAESILLDVGEVSTWERGERYGLPPVVDSSCTVQREASESALRFRTDDRHGAVLSTESDQRRVPILERLRNRLQKLQSSSVPLTRHALLHQTRMPPISVMTGFASTKYELLYLEWRQASIDKVCSVETLGFNVVLHGMVVLCSVCSLAKCGLRDGQHLLLYSLWPLRILAQMVAVLGLVVFVRSRRVPGRQVSAAAFIAVNFQYFCAFLDTLCERVVLGSTVT